jgi:hypothetical protein
MRHLLIVAALAVGISGCTALKNAFGMRQGPAHTAESTSIWGDWVLATPDSTAFYGASSVELSLAPTTFTLVARYPARAPITVTGSVAQPTNGVSMITLMPQTGATVIPGWGDEPLSMLASAAGNVLAFAPAYQPVTKPSSVWHRREAAERAGYVVKPPR